MTDPRLGWEPHKDPRSRLFPAVRGADRSRKPRSYTWRITRAGVLDQGREGACVGFGWAAELAARPVEVADVDDAYALRLYWQAQGIDRAAGRHYPEGATMLAGAKAVQRAGRVEGYRWAFGLQDVLVTLGYYGPVVLGIEWREGMYEARGGQLRVEGDVVGGHCILARGVSVPRRAVLLRNSWGPGWGVRGDAWVGWDDLDGLLRRDGEACIPEVRR